MIHKFDDSLAVRWRRLSLPDVPQEVSQTRGALHNCPGAKASCTPPAFPSKTVDGDKGHFTALTERSCCNCQGPPLDCVLSRTKQTWGRSQVLSRKSFGDRQSICDSPFSISHSGGLEPYTM